MSGIKRISPTADNPLLAAGASLKDVIAMQALVIPSP